MRWCVALIAGQHLVRALLGLAVGAAEAVWAAPVLLSAGNVDLLGIQTPLVRLSVTA